MSLDTFPVAGVRVSAAGTFSMQRPHPNQHGFLYQAERCTAVWPPGLRECPQYEQQESLDAIDLLKSIDSLLRAQDESAAPPRASRAAAVPPTATQPAGPLELAAARLREGPFRRLLLAAALFYIVRTGERVCSGG